MRITFWSWVYIALIVLELVAFFFGDHDLDLMLMAILLGGLVGYEQENDKLMRMINSRREDE